MDNSMKKTRFDLSENERTLREPRQPGDILAGGFMMRRSIFRLLQVFLQGLGGYSLMHLCLLLCHFSAIVY